MSMHSQKKIVLIGDFARDIAIKVRATRLCPEAPVPVVIPESTSETPGMAGNVLANLKSISGWPEEQFIVFRAAQDSIKSRYIDSATGYIMLRVDDDCTNRTKPFNARLLGDFLYPEDVGAIVISDYAKGFLSEESISEIAEYAYDAGIPTFLDTKLTLGLWSKQIFCVKINEKEYLQNLKLGVQHPRFYCQNLVATHAADGTKWLTREQDFFVPTKKVQVADVCGAGDTMLAGLVLSYVANQDLREAIRFANDVASFAVSKHGVYQVTPADVEAIKKG